MIGTTFIRAIFLKPICIGLEKHYQLSPKQLNIPSELFNEDMALIPFLDMVTWLEKLEEKAESSNYLATISDSLKFENMGILGEWFISSPDLSLTFRRINYGLSCLQSGAIFYIEQSGKIIKWTYGNDYIKSPQRIYDSLRVAIMFTNILRSYMGSDYPPIHVEISGTPMDTQPYEAFFGCSIKWNTTMTRIWVENSIFQKGNDCVFNVTKPMLLSNLQIDDLLNMPQPQDFIKTIYEMINYNRYYGRPNVNFIADKLGLSTQQLSRRLYNHGLNLTSITSYVLCNSAIKYMLEGREIKHIAKLLGYQSVESFSKAFKRYRGVTPNQYQIRLLERHR